MQKDIKEFSRGSRKPTFDIEFFLLGDFDLDNVRRCDIFIASNSRNSANIALIVNNCLYTYTCTHTQTLNYFSSK